MKKAIFTAEARAEFLAEVEYYNLAQSGLGERFLKAVEQAIKLALAFPEIGSPVTAGTRRIVVKTFPFSVVYKGIDTGIVVFAVAHHSRRPRYWATRLL